MERAKGGPVEGGAPMHLERLGQFIDEDGRIGPCRYRFVPDRCSHGDLLDAATYGDLPNKVAICAACGASFIIPPASDGV